MTYQPNKRFLPSLILSATLMVVNAQTQETDDEDGCLGFVAHPFTYFVLFSAMMVVPFYILATYVESKASTTKGLLLGSLWLIFGAGMAVFCLFDVATSMGTPGNLIVPLAWFLPSLLLILFRRYLLSHVLSQKWLVGLQLFRAIGGIFLIEMARGNLAPIFAYAAGIGDLLVALDAAVTLVIYRTSDRIPSRAIYFLIVIGSLDFLSAFFFGFFSTDTEAQLFYTNAKYNATVFPAGVIPLSLVPCAIFYHTLSFLNQRKFGSVQDPIYWTGELSDASGKEIEGGAASFEQMEESVKEIDTGAVSND